MSATSRRGAIGPRRTGAVLVTASALLLAACGGDDGSEDTTDDEADDSASEEEADDAADAPDDGGAEEEVTIRFTWWGNPERDELTNQMVDLFMEEYPHITVETEPVVFDGYFDSLAVSTAAGDAQDVITLGGAYPKEYGSAGQLLDLTTVADIVSLDEYSPNSYAESTIGDAVYGLPTGGNALGLFVNLDLVEQAGLELPDDSTWDWPDFVEFAGELSDALGDDVVGTDWRIQEVKGPWGAQRGTGLYNEGGGTAISAEDMTAMFEVVTALQDNGGMASPEITVEMNNTQMEQTLFGQGRAATMFGYSNQTQAFADLLGANIAMLKYPGESNHEGPGLTVLPSQFFAVYSGSDHPEEAAMLVDWLLNEPEAQKLILSNRGLSFNPNVLEAIRPELPEFAQAEADYLARIAEEGGPPAVRVEGEGEADDMTLRVQEQLLFGQITAEEAGQMWVDEANSITGG